MILDPTKKYWFSERWFLNRSYSHRWDHLVEEPLTIIKQQFSKVVVQDTTGHLYHVTPQELRESPHQHEVITTDQCEEVIKSWGFQPHLQLVLMVKRVWDMGYNHQTHP